MCTLVSSNEICHRMNINLWSHPCNVTTNYSLISSCTYIPQFIKNRVKYKNGQCIFWILPCSLENRNIFHFSSLFQSFSSILVLISRFHHRINPKLWNKDQRLKKDVKFGFSIVNCKNPYLLIFFLKLASFTRDS